MSNNMLEIRCTFEDGNTITSFINTNFQGAKDYFLDRIFNLGVVEDNLQKCVKVEEI